MERGERLIMRRPFSPRKAKARKASPAKPRIRKERETRRQTRCSVVFEPTVARGSNVQNDRMAARNINVDQRLADQPMRAESGVSLTIITPMSSKESVRVMM